VIYGERSFSFMADAPIAVGAALPHAQLRRLPGQDHNVAPAALAPVLMEFVASSPNQEPGPSHASSR
jgi:hypothetical protein